MEWGTFRVGIFAFGLTTLFSAANAADDIASWVTDGNLFADFRYRFENVGQDGFANDANASTVRLRFGAQSGEFGHIQGLIEGEWTVRVTGQYNDTINGKVAYPVVADPKNFEVNRLQFSFSGIPGTVLTLGRQRINIDTQRFVGAVSFRQNEQTFDAVRLVNRSITNLNLGYFYANRVNRIFGERSPASHFDGDVHALNADYQHTSLGKLSGYVYLIDLEQAATQSTATYGIQYSGKTNLSDGTALSYTLEYAHQNDYGRNPLNISLDYWHAEFALGQGGLSATAGLESLGGNGTVGFSTPLATLHKFQGYADTFLTTPASGILDVFGRVGYQTSVSPFDETWPIMLAVSYHDFTKVRGSGSLGGETDLEGTLKLSSHVSTGFKYANYVGGGGYQDRDKIWLSVDIAY